MTVRIAKPLSLRAGDQIVLVVVRGDRGSQCCSYDYQKKAAGLWPASIDERQGKLLRQCVRRDLLQIPEGEIGRAHVRTPVTNAPLVRRLLLEKKQQLNNTVYMIRSIDNSSKRNE